MPPLTLDTLCVTAELSSAKLEQVRAAFKNVHYHPDHNVPDDVLAEVDIWFGANGAIPPEIEDVGRIPKTRIVQLTSGGWWLHGVYWGVLDSGRGVGKGTSR